MTGRILDLVPGHTNIGRGQNVVHLVTGYTQGYTPGRINRNGTVSELNNTALGRQPTKVHQPKLKRSQPRYTPTTALVSCLGQGPCFSKITYMVTACKYSEGMHSTVVYCAFFKFPLMDNLGSIPAIDIFFYFRDNSVSCQKLDRLL